ncbi:unnamed protein product [Camellia sinensis]
MNEIESGRVELQIYSDESSLGWEIESKKSQTSKKSQSYSVEVQLQFLQVKLNPSLADAWLCLGNCIWKKGDLPSAKNCFTLALSKDRCGTLTGSRKDEKVSRQEYLKKMEQKKLKELRDDIEDEQYLFDGVKLIESEYGELSSHRRGAVAAVVCSLVLVLIKSYVESGGRKTIGNISIRDVQFLLIAPEIYKNYRGKHYIQDERINGGAFIGTDGLQFPHKLIPV